MEEGSQGPFSEVWNTGLLRNLENDRNDLLIIRLRAVPIRALNQVVAALNVDQKAHHPREGTFHHYFEREVTQPIILVEFSQDGPPISSLGKHFRVQTKHISPFIEERSVRKFLVESTPCFCSSDSLVGLLPWTAVRMEVH